MNNKSLFFLLLLLPNSFSLFFAKELLSNQTIELVTDIGDQQDDLNYQDILFKEVANDNIGLINTILEEYFLINSINKFGHNLLIHAVISGQLNAARLLIDKGIDLNFTDNDGNTALHISLFKRNYDLVDLLLSRGARVNIKNNNNETVINLLQNKQDSQMLKIFKYHE